MFADCEEKVPDKQQEHNFSACSRETKVPKNTILALTFYIPFCLMDQGQVYGIIAEFGRPGRLE